MPAEKNDREREQAVIVKQGAAERYRELGIAPKKAEELFDRQIALTLKQANAAS